MELSVLLKLMQEKNASDLFLTAGIPPTIKVDGRTIPASKEPLSPDDAMQMITGMMSPAQRDEFEATHECNFAVVEPGMGRFRAVRTGRTDKGGHPGLVLDAGGALDATGDIHREGTDGRDRRVDIVRRQA